MIFQIIGAFFAVCSLSVVLRCPYKYIVSAGFIGAAGWGIYLFSIQLLRSDVLAVLLAVLAVGMLSQAGAVLFKAPVTIFLVAGMIPFVPGTSMYQAVYYTIVDQMDEAGKCFTMTIQRAGVIALGIFLTDALFMAWRSRKI